MLMIKHFVHKRSYISEKDLIEYNSFCQLIPGPSSTQLLGVIAYKKGGFWLSFFSLIIWIMPASIIMGMLSFLVMHEHYQKEVTILFKFIPSVTVSFLLFSTIRYYKSCINSTITFIILVISAGLTLSFFKTPWIIPVNIIVAGFITNMSQKRIPVNKEISVLSKINWKPLVLFSIIFIMAALLSESARKNNWVDRKQFNLFENNYRFGSLVFGGGDVLLPLMIDQYVERPTSKRTKQNNPNIIKIDKNKLIAGFGLVKAIPGPVFSVSSYIGGLSLSDYGKKQQISGCFIGAISIFLPSIILLYFLIPFWDSIKKQVIVIRSLEGINAAVTGVMIATVLYLMDSTLFYTSINLSIVHSLIIILALALLLKTKMPPPIIVIAAIILGWVL